ncbi:hypothetical protein C0992_007650, partial [Termitomyces sp. T32_za158]
MSSFTDYETRKGPLAPFYRAGKLIPRIGNPFVELNTVIIRGLMAAGLLELNNPEQADLANDHESEEEDIEEYQSDEELEVNDNGKDRGREKKILMEKVQVKTFNTIKVLDPLLFKYMKKLCEMVEEDYYKSDLRKFVVVLIRGASSARTADTRKVKDSIITLMQNSSMKYLIESMNTPLPNEKSARGFNHIDTGLLICPAKLACQYNDEFRQELSSGKVEVTAHDMPLFLYDKTRCFRTSSAGFPNDLTPEEELDFDEYEQLTKGLCRGPLLISTCQHMLYGSGIERSESHATKRPIADKFSITTITPEIIAYTAIQARFALSSISQWNLQEGVFNFQDFYYNILSLFDDRQWAKETLAFWNKLFYSNDGSIRPTRKVSAPSAQPNNDISRIKKTRQERIRKERERLLQDRQNRRARREHDEREEGEEEVEGEREQEVTKPQHRSSGRRPAKYRRLHTGQGEGEIDNSRESEDDGNAASSSKSNKSARVGTYRDSDEV